MHKDIQQKYEKDQKERQIERNVSRKLPRIQNVTPLSGSGKDRT